MKLGTMLDMEMVLKFVIVSFLLPLVAAESCSLQNIPQFESQGLSGSQSLGNIQAIVPNYTFSCTGSVVQWGACIQVGDEQEYTIEFQVWRKSEAGNTNYSLVDSNSFSRTSPASDSDLRTICIREDVLPEQIPISVWPGDVVGFRFRYDDDDDPAGVQLNSAGTSVAMWYIDQQGFGESGTSRRSARDEFLDIIDYKLETAAPVITAIVDFLTPVTSIQPVISVTPAETTSPTEAVGIPTETPIVFTTASSEQRFLPVSTTLIVFSDVTSTPGSNIGQSNSAAIVRTVTQLSPLAVEPTPSNIEEQNPDDPSNRPGETNEAIIGIVIGVLFFIIALLVVFVIVLALKLKSISQRQDSPSGSGAPMVRLRLKAPKQGSLEDNHALIESHEYECTYSLLRESAPTSRDSTTNGYSIARLTTNASRTSVSTEQEYEYLHNASENGHIYQTVQSESPTNATSNYTNQPTHRQSAKYAELTTFTHQADNDASEPTVTYVPTEEDGMAIGGHYEMSENHQYNTLKFFVEDQTYWAPASTTSGLYAQLATKKYREIPRQQISQKGELGSGQFGQVHEGVWQPQDSGASLEIAVKTLKIDAQESDKVKFLQEAAIMGQFSHPNIVHLYGLVTIHTPNMIILELMSNGDLRSYIRDIDTNQNPVSQLEHQFLGFMREIAAGMGYLSGKAFVHRDLAARNVLLDQKFTCKIGDFGLARDLMNETYYISKGGQIPVKWTAPEALFYKKYSPASDVWSYGMVLFEIWSLGRKPFQNLSNAEVVKLVRTGYCQPPPPGCPRAVYKLMVDCWNPTHHERPTFVSIGAYLKGSDQHLLALAEDGCTSKTARELGAPISESRNLFLELQHQYKEQT